MPPAQPLFLSSGDLIADRRYEYARELEARGDLPAAADLLVQAVERAPDFATGWFALGNVRERLGNTEGAVHAFMQARAADPQDRHGAALRLVRLSGAECGSAMAPGYVQALFDQYAPDFDQALVQRLNYRGPALLRAALQAAVGQTGRPFQFRRVLDLGCGTGLMAEAIGDAFDRVVGFDLSPAMLERARRKGIYERLGAGDMLALLQLEADASADLAVAADALVYVADLASVCREVARVLAPGGLFAFTVEAHDGPGVVLGAKLRYAHGREHVRAAISAAGLRLLQLRDLSTRTENGVPVPGLIAVAER